MSADAVRPGSLPASPGTARVGHGQGFDAHSGADSRADSRADASAESRADSRADTRADAGPDAMAVTPTPWRLAALATLGGGLLTGWLATRPGFARWTVAGAIAVVAGYVVPLASASRRPPIEPMRAEPRSTACSAEEPRQRTGESGLADDRVEQDLDTITFSVVVAARDEVAVIPRLVADIAAQDHRTPDGRPLFELVIIDDRSDDGTGRAARLAALDAGIADVTRVVRRSGEHLPDGKGAALTAVQPDACRGDVVVVLDADARVGPAFLRTLAHYVAAGAQAVTARRRIADTSVLAGAQADEQTLDGELQRGRWALGGCSEFRGNGITVRRSLLLAVGGWRAAALTEDLDLSSRIAAAAGVRVAWALDAELWEEPVRTWSALWRQRVRWAEGSIRRTIEHGLEVVRSPRLSTGARLDFVAYTGQLAVPPVLVGALVAGVARRRPGPGLALLGAYGASSWMLGFDALRWETDGAGRALSRAARARRAIRVTAFGTVWIGVVPVAFWRLATRRGRVEYDKMPHGIDDPAAGMTPAAVP